MRININQEDLNKLYRKAVQNVDKITNFDLRRIFKIVYLKEELGSIFRDFLKLTTYEKIGKKKVLLEDLLDWINKNQEEEISLEEIRNFFIQIKSANIFNLDRTEIKEINFEEFSVFIYSPLNSIFDKKKLKPYQDDSKPLNYYFLSASHNSYLIGHQLYG